MNIITVFNYPDEEKYNNMFKIWLFQALKCKINNEKISKIKILTEGLNNNLIKFIGKINYEYIVIENLRRKKLFNVPERWLHNVGFKLYNLCNQTEPFIFIDADAIIINYDLSLILNTCKEKPLIAVNHQTIPMHTDKFKTQFINTGFLIVSDVKFLNFNKIYNTPIKYKCTGTDQLLIYNYCKTINYDYLHEKINWGWNSCGGYKKIEKNRVFSDKIKEKHEIYILHYWDIFKPWITYCPIYDYLEKKYKFFDLILNKIKLENFIEFFKLFDLIYEFNNNYYNFINKIIINKKFNIFINEKNIDNETLNKIKLINFKGNNDVLKKNNIKYNLEINNNYIL